MQRFITGRLVAWIATIAMLFNTLAPSVSHALVAAQAVPLLAQGSSWSSVCTDQGTLWIQTAADGTVISESKTAPPDQPAHLGQHAKDCPFCLSQANTHGLLGSDTLTRLPVPATAHSLAPRQPPRLHGNLPWQRPAPRAPPGLHAA